MKNTHTQPTLFLCWVLFFLFSLSMCLNILYFCQVVKKENQKFFLKIHVFLSLDSLWQCFEMLHYSLLYILNIQLHTLYRSCSGFGNKASIRLGSTGRCQIKSIRFNKPTFVQKSTNKFWILLKPEMTEIYTHININTTDNIKIKLNKTTKKRLKYVK